MRPCAPRLSETGHLAALSEEFDLVFRPRTTTVSKVELHYFDIDVRAGPSPQALTELCASADADLLPELSIPRPVGGGGKVGVSVVRAYIYIYIYLFFGVRWSGMGEIIVGA